MGPKRLLQRLIGNFGGQIAHEDGVVRPTIGPALPDAEGGPIEPEFRSGHVRAVIGLEHVLRCRVGNKLDETIAFGLARELVANDFDGKDLAGVGEAVSEVDLVGPVLQVTDPNGSDFFDGGRSVLRLRRRRCHSFFIQQCASSSIQPPPNSAELPNSSKIDEDDDQNFFKLTFVFLHFFFLDHK